MGQITQDLQGTLRAGDAAALGSALADALAQGDVTIATRDLTSLDSAIVQVLLSAQKTAAQLERNLQIDCPQGGALAAICEKLAIGPVFDLQPQPFATT